MFSQITDAKPNSICLFNTYVVSGSTFEKLHTHHVGKVSCFLKLFFTEDLSKFPVLAVVAQWIECGPVNQRVDG